MQFRKSASILKDTLATGEKGLLKMLNDENIFTGDVKIEELIDKSRSEVFAFSLFRSIFIIYCIMVGGSAVMSEKAIKDCRTYLTVDCVCYMDV